MKLFVEFLVGGIVSTLTLAIALWLISDEADSPFRRDGSAVAWAKCAGLSFGIGLLELIGTTMGFDSLFSLIAIVAWFGGVMALFERTFLQSLLIAVAVWGVGFLIVLGLALLLSVG